MAYNPERGRPEAVQQLANRCQAAGRKKGDTIMALGGLDLTHVLKVATSLRDGLDIFKCKLDGKPTKVSSGGKMKLDGSNVKITCSFQAEGSSTSTSVEAVR